MKWLDKLISRLRQGPADGSWPETIQANLDEAEISLFGVDMVLKRKFYLETPHEVSLFIPRAEIRQTTYEGTNKRTESEMILNSITIVHAPMRPAAGTSGPLPLPGTSPEQPGKIRIKHPKEQRMISVNRR